MNIKKFLKIAAYVVSQERVEIKKIRCSCLPTYMIEGYGGKEIKCFPPYSFFSMYLVGRRNEAVDRFVHWYDDQFKKYHFVSKKFGGMKKGSLHSHVSQLHLDAGIILESDLSNLSPNIYTQALKERVAQRFYLLESIVKNGYRFTADVAIAENKGDLYFLSGGHHRCAILHLLGFEYMRLKVIKVVCYEK